MAQNAGWYLRNAVGVLIRAVLVVFFLHSAYQIRLFAIKSYGRVIHEFDPWFNYRATEYLAEHGWTEFFHWFDYKVWYPLGRPVGTTIYPGMQITSVCIWNTLKWLGNGWTMSLNDVCCFVPAWFGSSATLFLGLLAGECSMSSTATVVAAGVMAVIPAHIMRSVGGGYDNESIALTAMCMTFYFWIRSLRAPYSTFFAVLAGLAYVYMVAAWGGYVFVINMVGAHAGILVLLGYFNQTTYTGFTLFYLIGTFGATRVPVVGWVPLKSLEQLGSCAVFLGYQAIQLCEMIAHRKGITKPLDKWKLRAQVFAVCGAIGLAIIAMLYPTGYFGPLGARIRGLFVKHTRTGNPLVDSVAEHQPANEQAYRTYLHNAYQLAPVGLFFSIFQSTPGSRFLILYGLFAWFFSAKMMRLIILTGPVASALCGVAVGHTFDWALWELLLFTGMISDSDESKEKAKEGPSDEDILKEVGDTKGSKKTPKSKTSSRPKKLEKVPDVKTPMDYMRESRDQVKAALLQVFNYRPVKLVRKLAAVAAMLFMFQSLRTQGVEFWQYSHQMAEQLSSPSIMFHATLRDGTPVTVDDYREAYWWLRDNTPEDSRVMAWWDYGYQITGIGNRTTIADGNTWNHEHIATLGRCLTAPEKDAHRIVRHLADYVLIWTGGGGDDLAKSPHMARIGNSVFRDICPDDPTCSQFGFYHGGMPTPMMAESLLYKLHSGGQRPGVTVDPNRFREVFRSRFNKVRIYKVLKVSQESKKWIADPANRICDAPGSWYCTGQYPPALNKLIKKRRNFAQLEDFNRGGGDDEYTREYMARMSGEKPPPREKRSGGSKKEKKEKKPKKAKPEKKKEARVEPDGESYEDEEYDDYDPAEDAPPQKKEFVPSELQKNPALQEQVSFENTEATSAMFQLISVGDLDHIKGWLFQQPDAAFMRSEDGRGALWWANEFGHDEIIQFLIDFGVRTDLKDSSGMLAADLHP